MNQKRKLQDKRRFCRS